MMELERLESPAPGRSVGKRYRLRRLLGSGGSCDVFEAVHLVTGRVVALKTLKPEFRQDADACFRMGQEARALAAVRHPNLVEILDAEIDVDEPFIALELLSGRTLEGLLVTRGRLPVAEAVDYARQIALAIRALHEAGWVHRDIKPSNVFLVRGEKSPQVKVIDLGIALRRGIAPSSRQTIKGTILGTISYMAPEQALPEQDGTHIDARTDVWQLGATLYDMLTGKVPFDGSYSDVIVEMTTVGAPRVRASCPEVPAALDDLVARALSPRPADRFPDAAAFAEALAALAVASDAVPVFDGASKRRHKRAAFVSPVRAMLEDGVADARAEDLSEAGMLILTSFAPAMGAELTVKVSLPISGRVATLPCIVRWVKNRGGAAGAGPYALGLEFRVVEPTARQEIERYVAALGG